VRAAAEKLGLTALITDDYLLVEKAIAEAAPELVLGTQMERHVAKKLGVPSAVISAPVHVQDFPARYSPQMGLEGANVLFDSWVHPLMMGLEEHLLHMFRDDFEFNDGAAPSHLAVDSRQSAVVSEPAVDSPGAADDFLSTVDSRLMTATSPRWSTEAEAELKKIPFFVRGKAKRNTESYALEHSLPEISLATLYDAKAHYGR